MAVETSPNQHPAGFSKNLARRGLLARLPDDGNIMRAVFFALLIAVAAGLYVDYDDLQDQIAAAPVIGPARQVLPSHAPSTTGRPVDEGERPEIVFPEELLGKPLSVELAPGGVLELTGTIDPGAASRFRAKTERIGEYVTRVDLNSAGGSVRDALAIGRIIRERGFETRVRDSRLCASSCPLIFAAGEKRIAVVGSAIGVHQVFSASAGERNADIEVSQTQALTAEITRHLETMDVDPRMWLHALDTPPDKLYYFSGDELSKYRLATELVPPADDAAPEG